MRILLKGFLADGYSDRVQRRSVLLENERVLAVEPEISGACAADRVWKFREEIIAPGFIDVHGHSDLSLLAAPEAFSKRTQGVTAEIAGNCGLSPFPLTPENREHLEELYADYGESLSWDSLTAYQELLARKKARMHLFSLCGHNTLRAAVAGYEPRELSSREKGKMKTLLRHTLRAGALGMSTGLLYVPGCFAGEAEIFALMQLLAAENKVYTTHLRSEGDELLENLESTLALAAEAHLKKVEISHFKTAGEANWGKLEKAFALMEEYRARGVDVHIDRYPYVESQTNLSVSLPPPWKQMGDGELTRLLAAPGEKEKLLTALRGWHDAAYWRRSRLTGTSDPFWQSRRGKYFSDLTDDPSALAVELLAGDAAGTTFSHAGMSEKNLGEILRKDFCFCGSDGNALPPDNRFGSAHPRAFGAAAKFMRMLLNMNIPLGEACRRISGSAAAFFSLPEIGTVVPGNLADLTVFSPDEIDSKADFVTPDKRAQGIRMRIFQGEAEEF